MSVIDVDKIPVVIAASSAPASIWEIPKYLLGRIYLIAVVLLMEYTTIVSIPHPWCHLHRATAGAIVFVAVFLFAGRSSLKEDRQPLAISPRLLVSYGISLVIIAVAHFILLQTQWNRAPFVAVWFIAIPFSAVVLFFGLIPVRVLRSTLRKTCRASLYASAAALLAVSFSDPVQAIWNAPQSWAGVLLQRSTFNLVGHTLRLFYPSVLVDPSTYVVYLPHFAVMIAGSCSGIEGLALTLLFSSGWLWYARRQLRFPRALLLVPCALGLIYALNLGRIALLLAIGNAGHPDIALNGFHSEAGWIAFNTVCLGLLVVADRLPWLQRQAASEEGESKIPTVRTKAERNVAAIYLLPFLAILAAALFSKAASSEFEWLYPLRFVAAAIVLWHHRAEYRRIDWRFGWPSIAVGTLVFGMWLCLAHWTNGLANQGLGAALAAMPAPERISWLIVRVAAAILTVPVAEELAFRGFLLRRIISEDVERVAYRSVTPLALLLSSVAFGLMHGKLWLAGIVTGLVYGLLVKRTGRLGDAVAAHATTNLLLAIWVLARNDWGLW